MRWPTHLAVHKDPLRVVPLFALGDVAADRVCPEPDEQARDADDTRDEPDEVLVLRDTLAPDRELEVRDARTDEAEQRERLRPERRGLVARRDQLLEQHALRLERLDRGLHIVLARERLPQLQQHVAPVLEVLLEGGLGVGWGLGSVGQFDETVQINHIARAPPQHV